MCLVATKERLPCLSRSIQSALVLSTDLTLDDSGLAEGLCKKQSLGQQELITKGDLIIPAHGGESHEQNIGQREIGS